ncbi:MAG TPA: hypothetical protein VFE18_12405 [Phenylobacterium sp.]|uniref:hypothetical protein n=1 Tax=Phenylobacterium sp. TaxID=1871053 RepID=UPI002D274D88|nr:hypothetical protein [Phenylobacterium sp.]HZZ68966.1 hypothetical protein [Phenylobacterium sp.]
MSAANEKQARAEAILGELAELGLMLARDLAVQAREAEDPQVQVALAGAFHKTSRAVRMTLALDFKLQRDAARLAREAEERAEQRAGREQVAAITLAPPSPREVRKGRVRDLLNRLIWNEAEGDSETYEVLEDDLRVRLDIAAEADGFDDLPLEVIARRLAADMNLSGTLTFTAPTVQVAREPAGADTG